MNNEDIRKVWFSMLLKIKNIPNILIVSIIISVIVIAANLYEYITVRQDIKAIMRKEALTLMDAIFLSSRNTVLVENMADEYLNQHLELVLTKIEMNSGKDKPDLESISGIIAGYFILDKEFNIVEQNISPFFISEGLPEPSRINFVRDLQVWDFITVRDSVRAALSPAGREDNRVVLYLYNESFLEGYEITKIGSFIQQLGDRDGVNYIVLQDSEGIISSTNNIDTISSINNDEFLQGIIESGLEDTRFFEVNDEVVFEVVKPFYADDNVISVFRIGISSEELSQVESRALNRMLIIIIVLILSMIVIFRFLVLRKTYSALDSEYTRYKTYSEDILENMSEAVIAVNAERKIIYLNTSSENLFKIPRTNLIGKYVSQCSPSVMELLKSIPDDLHIPQTEEKEMEINGNRHTLIIHSSVISNEAGLPETYIAVVEDVSERKQIELRLRERERMSLIGRMASAFAHEIRNPLNALSMVFQRFSREFSPVEKSDEYGRLSSIFNSELDRINIIVEDFLRLSRPARLKLNKVELDKLLNDMSLIFKDLAGKKGVDFVTNFEKTDPVNIDEEKFKQVIFNLFLNALDAVSEEGEIVFELKQNETSVLFIVKDNGKGIDQDKLPQIFDWYFTDKSKGSGMGLTITRKLVEAHGGKIEVDSEQGKGSVFTISLLSEEGEK